MAANSCEGQSAGVRSGLQLAWSAGRVGLAGNQVWQSLGG